MAKNKELETVWTGYCPGDLCNGLGYLRTKQDAHIVSPCPACYPELQQKQEEVA